MLCLRGTWIPRPGEIRFKLVGECAIRADRRAVWAFLRAECLSPGKNRAARRAVAPGPRSQARTVEAPGRKVGALLDLVSSAACADELSNSGRTPMWTQHASKRHEAVLFGGDGLTNGHGATMPDAHLDQNTGFGRRRRC